MGNFGSANTLLFATAVTLAPGLCAAHPGHAGGHSFIETMTATFGPLGSTANTGLIVAAALATLLFIAADRFSRRS